LNLCKKPEASTVFLLFQDDWRSWRWDLCRYTLMKLD
jgi:hypothetical protein